MITASLSEQHVLRGNFLGHERVAGVIRMLIRVRGHTFPGQFTRARDGQGDLAVRRIFHFFGPRDEATNIRKNIDEFHVRRGVRLLQGWHDDCLEFVQPLLGAGPSRFPGQVMLNVIRDVGDTDDWNRRTNRRS